MSVALCRTVGDAGGSRRNRGTGLFDGEDDRAGYGVQGKSRKTRYFAKRVTDPSGAKILMC